MREILFRGIDEGTQEWVFGYYCERPSEFGGEKRYYIFDDQTISKYNVFPETVGQYTGLTDKNGKKIFEGDIVKTDKFNTPNKQYIIEFDLLLGAFIGEDYGTMYFTTFDGDSELFEIIGNIHDNPELLKGGE